MSAQETDMDAGTLEERRQQNIQALLSNSLETCRQPLMSKYLIIKEGEQVLRREFRSPAPGAPPRSQALMKRLMARKRFVPWGGTKEFKPPSLPVVPVVLQTAEPAVEEPEELPPGVDHLVLWEPADAASEEAPVVVDPMLTRWLRPHQREGVQFLFECVTGQRLEERHGCILADDMGLGKTLQGITLLWTLLRQGAEAVGGNPIAKRAIICCPTSLVSNWDQECTKWLKGRVRTLALCETSRDDVIFGLQQFLSPAAPYHVLIISYETFRLHAARFTQPDSCDLLICDEAHRLKNDATLTNRALDGLPCKRRVLLSGTPMQNHLDEFFAMVDFCNPGVLGSPAEFRRYFEGPILAGREPGAPEDAAALGEARSSELSSIVNQFILRRTNKLLSEHLPPKVVEVVCCRLTPLQQQLYCRFLESATTRRLLSGSKATGGVLAAISNLKKLCNHPKLIYDALHSKVDAGGAADGWEGVADLFPPGLFDNGRPGRGGLAIGWEYLSGKMAVVARMLELLRQHTTDKVVIVSNYTQTLDLFVALCRARNYGYVRLDGSTTIAKRQKLVTQFNGAGPNLFVFLLSSKAGGCGLNLVGANRLVLFDPDWNPATDKQAAARVWRDGQQKHVYVYRMLTAGTIEEKVFQRQISKEGLQQVVDNAAAAGSGGELAGMQASLLSTEQLRQLFTLLPDTASDTYDLICAQGEGAESVLVEGGGHRPQVGAPGEEDLQNFGHHAAFALQTVPDQVLQQAAGEDVTFVFSCQVAGKKPVAAAASIPGASTATPPNPVAAANTAAAGIGGAAAGVQQGTSKQQAVVGGSSSGASGAGLPKGRAAPPAAAAAATPPAQALDKQAVAGGSGGAGDTDELEVDDFQPQLNNSGGRKRPLSGLSWQLHQRRRSCPNTSSNSSSGLHAQPQQPAPLALQAGAGLGQQGSKCTAGEQGVQGLQGSACAAGQAGRVGVMNAAVMQQQQQQHAGSIHVDSCQLQKITMAIAAAGGGGSSSELWEVPAASSGAGGAPEAAGCTAAAAAAAAAAGGGGGGDERQPLADASNLMLAGACPPERHAAVASKAATAAAAAADGRSAATVQAQEHQQHQQQQQQQQPAPARRVFSGGSWKVSELGSAATAAAGPDRPAAGGATRSLSLSAANRKSGVQQ